MEALFSAIYTKITGSTFNTAIGGRLYLVEAPQGITSPYAVFFMVSNVPLYATKKKYENSLVQFNVFSKPEDDDMDEINDIYSKLISLYDDCNLSVSGYTFLKMERELSFCLKPNGIWQYSIQYRIINEGSGT